MKMEFKVSRDEEAKKEKDFILWNCEVDIASASREMLEKYAMKSFKIEIQGQIRPNWTQFEELWIADKLPKTMIFGQGLFAKKVATRPPTQEEIEKSTAEKVRKMQAEGASDAEIIAVLMGKVVVPVVISPEDDDEGIEVDE
jgi:hypothetical protein